MKKFNKGDIVLYRNGDSFELGEVKERIPSPRHMWLDYEIHSWNYNEHKGDLELFDRHNRIIVSIPDDVSMLTDDEILEYLLEIYEEYKYIEDYEYRVYYHTGETSALTHSDNLYPIVNSYAFLTVRRHANHQEVPSSILRNLASDVLDKLHDQVWEWFHEDLFTMSDEDDEEEVYDGLIGDRDKYLDIITEYINDWNNK